MNRIALATAASLLAVTGLAVAHAVTPDQPMYLWVYYSDASKTTEVGTGFDLCTPPYQVDTWVSGAQTAHFDKELYGWCREFDAILVP